MAFGNARKIIRTEQEKTSYVHGNFYEYQAEIVAKLLSVKPEQMKEKIDTLIYKGWEPLFKDIKLYKNVVETLTDLRKSGYKLALLSDFPPEKKLEYLGISGVWDAVLCSERCGAIKPHLLSFKELTSAMALPCEKILYVGNSRPYDIAGAKKAGMRTAWIKSVFSTGGGFKKPKPDFIFSNYRQLYNYMINY